MEIKRKLEILADAAKYDASRRIQGSMASIRNKADDSQDRFRSLLRRTTCPDRSIWSRTICGRVWRLRRSN